MALLASIQKSSFAPHNLNFRLQRDMSSTCLASRMLFGFLCQLPTRELKGLSTIRNAQG